jgi:hypothetical protein
MTESFVFTIGIPIIVSLVVSVVFLERVVQVSVKPEELRNNTKIKWHLGIFIRLVIVPCTNRVDFFVNIRVHNCVTPVVMSLLPIVLREVR